MPKITTIATAGKPRMPRPDFPLLVHQRGNWANKVGGNFLHFGNTANDPKGAATLEQWLLEQKDDLLSGRMPRLASDGRQIVAALKVALAKRTEPKDDADGELVSSQCSASPGTKIPPAPVPSGMNSASSWIRLIYAAMG